MRKAPYLTLFVLLAAASHADDGFLTFGGTPRLMSKHPSIRMARERVVLTIRPQGYHVDATFVFHNSGPACSVRMGFPDQGAGADETSHMEEVEAAKSAGKRLPAFTGLQQFRSWIDGKSVKTALLAEGEKPRSWHVKNVTFGRNSTRIVRVAYDADGGGATSSGKAIRSADYVLHTGASWKDTIGKAEVIVRFAPGSLSGPIHLAEKSLLKTGDPFSLPCWPSFATGTVFWSGYAKPTIHGREIRFVRTELEPKEGDDVALWFGYGHQFR